jgi:hypothetical protein
MLEIVICKNPTYSTAFCQWKFKVEAFHLKLWMDKVHTLLRISGRKSGKGEGRCD